MANEYYWKVWLRPNLLTKDDDNDYIAEVLTQKDTLHNENIANAIIKEGSEIKYDTLLSIIKQRDRIVREHLMMGYSLLTEVCQYTPRITGPWGGETAKFDPAIHKLTLDIVPSAEMRDALSKVGVEVLGAKSEVGRIGMVTDTLLISRVANASIYVCRADYTHKADYTLINELSEQKKLPNLCTLINGLDMKKKKYGYYYGYGKYGKYYGYGKKYGYGYGYGTENVNKK